MAIAAELGSRHLEQHRWTGMWIVAARAVAVGHRLVKHRQAGAGTDIVMAVGAEIALAHSQKHWARRPVWVMADRAIVFGG